MSLLVEALVRDTSSLENLLRLIQSNRIRHPNPDDQFIQLVLERATTLAEEEDQVKELSGTRALMRLINPGYSEPTYFARAIPLQQLTKLQEKYVDAVLRSKDHERIYQLTSPHYRKDWLCRDGLLSPSRLEEIQKMAQERLLQLAATHAEQVIQGDVDQLDKWLLERIVKAHENEVVPNDLLWLWYRAWLTLYLSPKQFEELYGTTEIVRYFRLWRSSNEIVNDLLNKFLTLKPEAWKERASYLNREYKLGRGKEIRDQEHQEIQMRAQPRIVSANTTQDCLYDFSSAPVPEEVYKKALGLAKTWQDYWLLCSRLPRQAQADGLEEKARNMWLTIFTARDDFDSSLGMADGCPWKDEEEIANILFSECLSLAETEKQLLQLLPLTTCFADERQQAIEKKLRQLHKKNEEA